MMFLSIAVWGDFQQAMTWEVLWILLSVFLRKLIFVNDIMNPVQILNLIIQEKSKISDNKQKQWNIVKKLIFPMSVK